LYAKVLKKTDWDKTSILEIKILKRTALINILRRRRVHLVEGRFEGVANFKM
jgi:hypothetical protein